MDQNFIYLDDEKELNIIFAASVFSLNKNHFREEDILIKPD